MAISAHNRTLFSMNFARHLGPILGMGSLVTALVLATACSGSVDEIPSDKDDDPADNDGDDDNDDSDDDDSDDDDSDDDDSDDDDDDNDDTSSLDTETTTENSLVSVTIKATLLDPKGDPIKAQFAKFCQIGHGNGCTLFMGDHLLDEGKIEAKLELPTGHYDLVVGSTDLERHFSQTPNVAVIEKDGELDFGNIYVPEAPELTKLAATGSTTVEIDDKLTLQITGEAMWDCDQVGGVAVEDKHMPPYLKEKIPGEVLGVWAFVFYGACEKKNSPKGKTMGVTIHDALGQKAGDKVDVYQVDWDTGEPIKLTSATVDNEGKTISTKADDGLTRLTWTAIVKPE